MFEKVWCFTSAGHGDKLYRMSALPLPCLHYLRPQVFVLGCKQLPTSSDLLGEELRVPGGCSTCSGVGVYVNCSGLHNGSVRGSWGLQTTFGIPYVSVCTYVAYIGWNFQSGAGRGSCSLHEHLHSPAGQ